MNYKTRPCDQFFEKGYCYYGNRCQYLHSELKYMIEFRDYLLNVYNEKKLIDNKIKNLTLESNLLQEMINVFLKAKSIDEFFELTNEMKTYLLI